MILKDNFDSPRFKCYFIINGISELCICLHAMSEPDHHTGVSEWVKRKYNAMSPDLRKEVDFFSKKYAQWLFVADFIGDIVMDHGDYLEPEATIEKLREMSDETFAYSFLGLSAFDFNYEELRKWIADPGKVSNEDLREQGTFFEIRDVRNFLKDIPGYRERLADVLSRCWNDWFKKSWSRIEEYEEEMLNKERLAFSHSDPIEYLKTFSSRVNVSEGRLVFQKDPDYSIAIKDIEELFIVSSVFSMPHTLANISGHRVNFVLNYDFRSIDLSYEINPETMLVLGAICDETRLRMMKILWDRDATTKEIAELLELSQSNISLHLKQMKEAGLVESSKVKRFVYYHLIKEPIMGIQDAITEYLSY